MNVAMILAGGTGTRFGADCPKQFVKVLEKPILVYTAEIYQKHKAFDAIEIVCHKDWMGYCNQLVKEYHLDKVHWLTIGGKTFQESVINGIECLKAEIDSESLVFIHYGASPFTSEKIINDVMKKTKEKGSAVTTTPCFQLMGSNDENGTSRTWIDRDKYIQIACPYGFRFSYLTNMYERANAQGLIKTIEPHTTSLMYALGDILYQAYGDQTNIKITTKEDLELFEGFILRKALRNGKKHEIIKYLM